MDAAATASRRLAEADAAFARADWEAARALYAAALEAEPSAAALDGLGWAHWWLGQTEAAAELLTKAFAEFRRRGERERAAYLATFLAAEFRIAGNASAGKGWIGRARRLLEGVPDAARTGGCTSSSQSARKTPTTRSDTRAPPSRSRGASTTRTSG